MKLQKKADKVDEKKNVKMGLTRFWLRLLLVLLGIIVIWQAWKTWNLFTIDNDNSVKVNTNELDAESIKGNGNNKDVQRIHIDVYYEALCSDSRGFVLHQLQPMYEKIPDNVVIEMIPYGKATTTMGPNGLEFKCQHGPRECEANTIHACSIDIIKNPLAQLNFLACMIDRNLWPVNITKTCAEKFNLNAETILSCARTAKGAELLAKYGRKTNNLKPPVNFIPTITLDGDSSNQPLLLNNLLAEVCKHFVIPPAGCT